MKVTIERKPYFYTKHAFLWGLFGGKDEQMRGNDTIELTIHFTEEEKEIIRRAPFLEHMILETPQDKVDYEDWQAAREKRLREGQGAGGYLGGLKTHPRYQNSLVAKHFLENPTRIISDTFLYNEDIGTFGEKHYVFAEKTIEENIRELKQLIDAISQHPQGKRELEL